MTPNILFEDNHIIVCFKPAGIPTQSGRITTPDMVSLLTNYLNHNPHASSPSKPPYVALINRLDQPVEGLLLVAKTPFSAKELNRQMEKGEIIKIYIALLSENPKMQSQTVIDYLKKDNQSNQSMVVPSHTKGAKKAILSYTKLEEAAAYTKVQIQLDTGRHHQIRVQFAHMGCPILGDQKYGLPTSSKGALCLCAASLSFTHPKTKKKLCFECTPSFC